MGSRAGSRARERVSWWARGYALIHRKLFERILTAHPSLGATGLHAETVEACLRAARSLYGPHAQLEGQWSSVHGVQVSLVMTAREQLVDVARDLSRSALLAYGAPFVEVANGDELEFPLSFEVPVRVQGQPFPFDPALLGPAWPWTHPASALHDAAAHEVERLVERLLPLPALPTGSLGHLLQRGGLALVGCAARFESAELVLERTLLERCRVGDLDFVRFGYVLRFEGPSGLTTVHVTDVRSLADRVDWFERSVTVDHAHFAHELRALARLLHAGGALREQELVARFSSALLAAPAPGSLEHWLRHELELSWFPSLAAPARLVAYQPQLASLDAHGARVQITLDAEGEAAHGYWLALGWLDVAAASRPRPQTDAELAHVRRLLEGFRDACSARLRQLRAREISPAFTLDQLTWSWTYAPWPMLAYALEHGLPPPPPVPPFDEAALSRAAASIGLASREVHAALAAACDPRSEHTVFAVYDVAGHQLVLADATCGRPFDCASLFLRAPETTRLIPVLVSDPANPSDRAVLDGDGFAIRRLLEWLRGAIVRADLDPTIAFEGSNLNDEDEPLEPSSLLVSEWLHFDLPASDDARLIDWRCQHYVAPASPSLRRWEIRSEPGDIAVWRNFLELAIDPRFSATRRSRI